MLSNIRLIWYYNKIHRRKLLINKAMSTTEFQNLKLKNIFLEKILMLKKI